ncbi:MAG: hypothetical protein IPK26_20435 [Planctomycetes bacterium]|nr:hypothetical protein [Planctomycetota bacterium]
MPDSGQVVVHAKDWFDGQRSRYERPAHAVVRELIQNACDALLRAGGAADPRIRLLTGATTLRVIDQGIGFDAAALDHLAVVRASGSAQARKAPRTERPDGFDIEGRFGVGTYATALCATAVTIRTASRTAPEAWQWLFRPADFSYTKSALQPGSRPPGTEVELVVAPPWREQLLEPEVLTRIVREVCDFIPFPIHVNDSPAPVNSRIAPWDRPTPAAACNAFLRERGLISDDTLLQVVLPWRADLGLGGVLYVPRNAAKPPGIDLHVNRYAVTRAADLLPPSLTFLHGVVIARDIEVNEARERVALDDQRTRALVRRLEAWAITGDPGADADSVRAHDPAGGLAALLRTGNTSCRPLLAEHGRALMRATANSPLLRTAIGRHLPLPMVLGEPATLAELRTVEDTLRIVESPDALPAARQLAESAGHKIVDATASEVRAFVEMARTEWRLPIAAITAATAPEAPAARWQTALALLKQRHETVREVRIENLGPDRPVLAIDPTALRAHPLFKLADMFGMDWQQHRQMLSVPEEVLDEKIRPGRAKLLALLAKSRWSLVFNPDHPLAEDLRRHALTDLARASALADVLLWRALLDCGFTWDADVRREFTSAHDAALSTLIRPRPTQP